MRARPRALRPGPGARVTPWVDTTRSRRVVPAAALALVLAATAMAAPSVGETIDDVDDLETELHANISFVEREGETGESAGPAAVDVRSSNDSTILEVNVTYNVTGGTADAADYQGGHGTLVFNASGQVRTIELGLAADDVAEADETVKLTLSSDDPTVVFGVRNHTHTILDDPPNQPPEAPDLEVETEAGTSTSGTLPGSDPDGDALTWSVAVPPSQGSVAVDPGSGEFTYTPDDGFTGTDAFDYVVSDGAASGTGQVSVTVTSDGPGSSDDGSTILDGTGDGSADGGPSEDGSSDGDAGDGTGNASTSAGASDDGDVSGAGASGDGGSGGGGGTMMWWLASSAVVVGACAALVVYGYRRDVFGGF